LRKPIRIGTTPIFTNLIQLFGASEKWYRAMEASFFSLSSLVLRTRSKAGIESNTPIKISFLSLKERLKILQLHVLELLDDLI